MSWMLASTLTGALDVDAGCFLFMNAAILVAEYFTTHPPKNFTPHERMNFDGMTDHEFKDSFRFTKEEVNLLCDELDLPEEMRDTGRNVFSGREALCILLWRLSYANKWSQAVKIFGRRSTGALSMVFMPKVARSRPQAATMMMDLIIARFGHLVEGLPHRYRNQRQMRQFGDAIRAIGLPISNCIGRPLRSGS
jgi:hypothetical protein